MKPCGALLLISVTMTLLSFTTEFLLEKKKKTNKQAQYNCRVLVSNPMTFVYYLETIFNFCGSNTLYIKWKWHFFLKSHNSSPLGLKKERKSLHFIDWPNLLAKNDNWWVNSGKLVVTMKLNKYFNLILIYNWTF